MFGCPICGKKFSDTDELAAHIAECSKQYKENEAKKKDSAKKEAALKEAFYKSLQSVREALDAIYEFEKEEGVNSDDVPCSGSDVDDLLETCCNILLEFVS